MLWVQQSQAVQSFKENSSPCGKVHGKCASVEGACASCVQHLETLHLVHQRLQSIVVDSTLIEDVHSLVCVGGVEA